MQPESPLPPASPSFTPPGGVPPQKITPKNTTKTVKWIVIGALGLFVLLLLVAVILAAMQSDNKPNGSTSNQPDSSNQNDQQANQNQGDECTETLQVYRNQDLGFEFCYPQVWGDVSVQDAKFAATDAGSRYRLTFSKKPAVNFGVVSDDWSTTAAREGVCNDPAAPLPKFSDFSASWKVQNGGAGPESAMRGIEVLANAYLIQEEVDSLIGNGVCLQGFTIINGRVYKHTAASYSVAFNSEIKTVQAHIDTPNILIPRQERTDFAAFVKSVKAL